MPFIFGILVILVGIVVARDNNKFEAKRSVIRAKSIRKTNAKLERSVLDSFLRQGKTFDEAYDATLEEMPKRGYDPCIPKTAYKAYDGYESSYVECEWKFDSEVVKSRREALQRAGLEVTDEKIYERFPTNQWEYDQDCKRCACLFASLKVGECFIHPDYGTCQIMEIRYSPDGTRGHYLAKELKTGHINMVRIGDPKITLMNDRIL